MKVKEVTAYHFIQRLKGLPFVDAIYLYGSRAREDAGLRSDIDLAVVCPMASLKDWQTVQEIIEQADTLLQVDCVRFDALDEADHLKQNIIKHKKVLYQKGERWNEPARQKRDV